MVLKRWLHRCREQSRRAMVNIGSRRRFLTRIATALLSSTLVALIPAKRGAIAATNIDLVQLKNAISGRILMRADSDYEIWRLSMMWQVLKADRYPDFMVQAANEADVIAAVNFAREHGIKIAVRCGGHSWCHSAMRDGGMLLDISSLRDVSIDAPARTATVQPAVNGRELVKLLEPHSLAFPIPHCGMVPMSGYLLGGGLGWNGESWEGMACFSVTAIDIVTPDGTLITADAEHHAEWFLGSTRSGSRIFWSGDEIRLTALSAFPGHHDQHVHLAAAAHAGRRGMVGAGCRDAGGQR